MKNRVLLPTSIFLFLLFSGFHCGIEDCVTSPVRLSGGTAFSLDNRGAAPVLLDSNAQGFLPAYGVQVQIECEFSDDTNGFWASDCEDENLEIPAGDCRMYTLLDMPNGVAAGSDVSDMFRIVDRYARPLKYRPVSEAMEVIARHLSPGTGAPFDFLLVQTLPQSGTYQFEFRMENTDSILLNIPVNPILLQ